jgi:hypothetical protein
MSAGNAMAAGTMGQANAWGNALGQVANIWSQNRALDKYLSPQQSFTGVGAVPY